MSLWVLDTAMLTFTLWLRGQETVAARIANTPRGQQSFWVLQLVEITDPTPGTLSPLRHVSRSGS